MTKPTLGPVQVVVMGLGYIGQEIARVALMNPELKVVAAIDSDPKWKDSSLGKALGTKLNVPVFASIKDAFVDLPKGTVLLHATGSRLKDVFAQLREAIEHGAHIVSTCEELAFPWLNQSELADELDALAQKNQVSVVGTGVNPGFVLDRLIACAGQACGQVTHVRAERLVDARTRREALQRKIGAGITEEEFFKRVENDSLGHVGLIESAVLTALGLGIECDDYEEEIIPVFAEEDIEGGAFPVKKGQVAGIYQTATGLEEGVERVRLELTMAVGLDESVDRIWIDSDPKVEMEIRGGIAGDRATANLVVNAAPRITAAEHGLLTVLELPVGR